MRGGGGGVWGTSLHGQERGEKFLFFLKSVLLSSLISGISL